MGRLGGGGGVALWGSFCDDDGWLNKEDRTRHAYCHLAGPNATAGGDEARDGPVLEGLERSHGYSSSFFKPLPGQF